MADPQTRERGRKGAFCGPVASLPWLPVRVARCSPQSLAVAYHSKMLSVKQASRSGQGLFITPAGKGDHKGRPYGNGVS